MSWYNNLCRHIEIRLLVQAKRGITLSTIVRLLCAVVVGASIMVTVGAGAASADQLVSGYWRGTFTEHGKPLSVVISFSQASTGGWSGRFTADSQAVMEYPFDSVSVKGSKISFVLGGGSLSFTGLVESNAITGTFSAGKDTGSFSLERSAAPDFPYVVQNVVFHSGSVRLAGSLYVPRGPGKHRAVVLLHGSGPQTRWGTPRFIADRLARSGVAALIYDKRGSGESGGDWRTASYEDLADDAIAAIGVLRAHRNIDASKIGIWGHSEGGSLAPLIASRSSNVAFVVAADAPATVTYEGDIYRVSNALRDSGWTGKSGAAALALYTEFVTVARTGRGHAELQRAMKKAEREPWFSWLGIPPRDSWVWAWYPLVADYDPRPYWTRVNVPVLLVYGERDRLMPVDANIATIESLVHSSSNENISAIILPQAPHTLDIQPGPKDSFFWWHVVAGYPDLIIDWVERV